MTRSIAVISGKGGVGKTTLTSNLAYALTELGEDVIAMDTNLTTPNLGLHFGMHLLPHTLHDVLRGKTRLREAIYPHPFGFKFIPASISVKDLTGVDPADLSKVTFNLVGKADYILMDCAAGLGREALSAIDAADEVILITNPDMPSLVDVMKVAGMAGQMGKHILGVVVNRRKGKKHEVSNRRIREILGLPIIAAIPEDTLVGESIAARQPILEYAPDSEAAMEIRRLAHNLTGREFQYKRAMTSWLRERLFGWVTR